MRIPKVKLTFWWLVLAVLMMVGLYATILRFSKGLGAATGLSDEAPWGIWIGFDILCGVGLAAGGFTLAAAVYIFRLEKYRPILRATILTAFLGYLMAIVSLLIDIGHPYRIWHPMVMWNEHSPMFEVAWCVMLYTTVLAIEFSPAVFEKLGLKRPLKIVHALVIPTVILGVILSTLHQSTLGTLFVIAPDKVHGLWYTPLLPVLFYISAIAIGLAMVIFESTISARAFGTSLHGDIVAGLAKAAAYVMGVYLVVRFASLAARGSLGLIFEGSVESWLFILEIMLGFVIPILLFSNARVRASQSGRFYTAVLAILGFVLNRLNVSLTGMARYQNNAYFPSFLEVATTVFVISAGIVAFALIARYFPIFPSEEEGAGHHDYRPLEERPRQRFARPMVATPAGTAFLAGLALLFAIIAYSIRAVSGPADASADPAKISALAATMRKVEVAREAQLHLPEDYSFPTSPFSPGKVVFSHKSHVVFGEEACTNCHLRPYPMRRPDASKGKLVHQRMYGCAKCHDGTRAFDVERDCAICHIPENGHKVYASSPKMQSFYPEDAVMPSLTDTMGKVTFRHTTHLKDTGARCSDCHPVPYPMAKPKPPTGSGAAALTAAMDDGHRCAKCHDGKTAFGITGRCDTCHGGG